MGTPLGTYDLFQCPLPLGPKSQSELGQSPRVGETGGRQDGYQTHSSLESRNRDRHGRRAPWGVTVVPKDGDRKEFMFESHQRSTPERVGRMGVAGGRDLEQTEEAIRRRAVRKTEGTRGSGPEDLVRREKVGGRTRTRGPGDDERSGPTRTSSKSPRDLFGLICVRKGRGACGSTGTGRVRNLNWGPRGRPAAIGTETGTSQGRGRRKSSTRVLVSGASVVPSVSGS